MRCCIQSSQAWVLCSSTGLWLDPCMCVVWVHFASHPNLGSSGVGVWHTQPRQSQRASRPRLSIWKVIRWTALPPYCMVIAFTRTSMRYEGRLDNLNLSVLIRCHCWLSGQSVSPVKWKKKMEKKALIKLVCPSLFLSFWFCFSLKFVPIIENHGPHVAFSQF